MGTLVVGVGDGQLSRNPEDILTTYALGSCIAVLFHDPQSRVSGLLHFMLPDSQIDAAKATQRPWMYADTGIRELLARAQKMGANRSTSVIWLAGGAQMLNGDKFFNIGKRNLIAIKKLLWKTGLLVRGEDCGGSVSRTVRLHVGNGQIWVRAASSETTLAEGEREWRLMC